MNESMKLAFEFAREIATQLITLSTALLGLTITFTKDLLDRIPSGPDRKRMGRMLQAAWACHLLAIGGGIWTLMAITGTLGGDTPAGQISLGHAIWPARFQIILFVCGTAIMVYYARFSLRNRGNTT